MCASKNPDIVCILNHDWMMDDIEDNELYIDGYTEVDAGRSSGGWLWHVFMMGVLIEFCCY